MSEHNVGKLIAKLRKENGWTQVELAQRLQVSDKAISKWESGAGLPEISQFPILAKLFNVSVDYLLTGKEIEKEIITISKSELCAQKDDVVLAEEVKDLPSDEDGKTIVDYIIKYQSLNVFKKLCEINDGFITRFKVVDALTFSVLSNSLYLLNGKRFGNIKFENENTIKWLLPTSTDEEDEPDGSKQCCLLPQSFFEVLVTDDRINSDTMNILLSPQDGRRCVWYRAFPLLIDCAYRNGKIELFNRLLDLTEKNNEYAYDNIRPSSVTNPVKRFYILGKNYGLVPVYQGTFQVALNNGDFDIVKRFNEINNKLKKYCMYNIACYVASDDVIRLAKLRQDKSISETEIAVQSAIHNSIISIDELLDVKDLTVVKKALYEYPIHYFERLYRLFTSNDERQLYRLAVDDENANLADGVVSGDVEKVKSAIIDSWCDNKNQRSSLNCRYLFGEKGDCGQFDADTDIDEIYAYITDVKNDIIAYMEDEEYKDKILDEYTPDYFYTELKNGNDENVIVKLCVRLEAVLKCDYGYTGSFIDMIDQFCNERLTDKCCDDENFYASTVRDEEHITLLHKLRKARNSIVHAKKSGIKLTNDDLKRCINYICSL